MAYFLGIDTGGTKTHALIADDTGRPLGFGTAGPGNHEVVGYEGVSLALKMATDQALTSSGLTITQISSAGFGVAGFDFPSERPPTVEAIQTLGLNGPFEVVNDVVLGLLAGAKEGWGVVIDAGTGNNVRGRDQQGREGCVTGCGIAFGEHGGASELVHRAVLAVTYAWTQRGPATILSDAFIQRVGAKNLADLIEGLALNYYSLDADAARLIFQVAQTGDAVARQVIDWTADELGQTACAVIRQLEFEQLDFDVILIGSLFKAGPMYIEPLQRTIHRVAPGACFSLLQAPPVTGAVLLAMEQVGLRDPRVRAALTNAARSETLHAAIDR